MMNATNNSETLTENSSPELQKAVSFRMEVLTGRDEWTSNGCRYATLKEAESAGKELLSRWFVPIDSRGVPSEDPVNYRFNFERYKSEPCA